jgi:flagellin-like hook-associated protein FlgL
MDMRVTPRVLQNRALLHARRQNARLAVLQEQASTGIRLLRPSDGPMDMMAVLHHRSQDLRLDTYLTNIHESRTTLDITVSALNEAGRILTQARDIAIEGSQSTTLAPAYEALAKEVDSLITRMLDVSNTQHSGRYLFSGTATGTVPFTVQASDSAGRPLSIAYGGAQQRFEVPVGPGLTVDTLYAGDDVFQDRQRGPTTYLGSTGAVAGSGTDSATGQGSLLVRHVATTYAAGSGVQPGTGSAGGDTVLGPLGSHTLTIVDTSGTGASGTVALNGGPAFTFTNTDSNLAVSGPGGDVVYLDMTAITPGFSGAVALAADGTLSVDGGLSEIAIDFSSNQQVQHSLTGSVTNVDSSGIRRSGTDLLNYSGSYDAFEILLALRDDLRNTAGLSLTEQSQAISGRIAELERVRTAILDAVGEQSATLQSLEAIERRAEDVQLETRKLSADLEGADLSEVVIGIQAQENLLRLTLASAVRVIDASLLDFLG